MSNSYKVKVDKNFEFDFTDKDISEIDAIPVSDSQYHIIDDYSSYQTEISNSDFNKKEYTVKVNNTEYQVTISGALDLQIAAMGFSLGSSKQVNAIKAPMPGLLLDIQVEAGQEVKEDDPLLILEAMKMENVILSPRNGVIKGISVSKGDAVDKGQLLVEFE
ncbi:acetyl-CoA carboxylase biotin carboxyl carrier protein subunit [Aquimarina sp. D1M17]|uniref:acetyl-CoA carboxylase biotin carboxyl carrier protein subunit n=1 Tax=Aquimarina acroporae TaxID=2937283 RepID=UPI0020BF4BB2|nr:acetyl-CoA carboxylase biotin carboxyl carrier protein subunit [Aquimarina acroporae]MCK8523449.1 acetyl-CoA carboxylase biotin carboxyl carrier protein subunit [Aquimarina acroporae]